MKRPVLKKLFQEGGGKPPQYAVAKLVYKVQRKFVVAETGCTGYYTHLKMIPKLSPSY